jgi:hypothetical protein
MTTVRRLEIRIDQTGDAQKGIGKLAGVLGPVGKAAGLAVGGVTLLGGAAVATGSKLVGLGADAFEMEGKFNVVFGDSAESARASLEKFGNEVGRSTFELEEMASSVQDTFVPMGFARDKAAELSDGLVKLAVDVGSFNNANDVDVMRDFQSALVGNHETVRKFGIVITEATLDQELLRMGVEGGTKAATEQEKVQARLNLIYAGTTDAQGDATRTADSWANQMRALNSTISEGATAMGLELIPVVQPLLKDFTAFAADIIPKAVAIFKEFAGDLKENVGPAIEIIKQAIERIAKAFGMNTDEVSGTDVILKVFKATLDAVVIGVQLAAIVIDGISRGIEGMRHAIDSVIGYWNRLKDSVRDAVGAVPDWLIPGSPTKFELGLRGIGDAMKKVNTTGFRPGIDDFGGHPPADGAIVINLHYAPAVSLADRYEAERVLAPMVAQALRGLI